MGTALRDMLPYAVAIAVSPIPIIAIVFMLITGEGRAKAVAVLAGWALALVVVCGGVAALDIAPQSDSGSGVAAVRFALAAILLVVIAVELRHRPRDGRPAEPPRFMRVIEGGGSGRAFGIGMALILLNLKDGALAISAGAKLGDAAPGLLLGAVCVAIFTVVASLTMIVPVLLDLAYGERAQPVLHRAHLWLERHGSTAVLITLGLIVVVLLVQGAQSL